MKLYTKLSQISFLKNNYSYKFLFVAFIGIHIPLLGLIVLVIYNKNKTSESIILTTTLILTLLATAITLFLIKKLIKPIELASLALVKYNLNRELPILPSKFSDEAGLLMSNINKSIHDYESIRIESQDLIYLISHDLRNYIGNSKSISKLILKEEDLNAIQEYAELIIENSNQQFTFVETIIDLLKQEENLGRKSIEFEEVNFEKIVEIVINRVTQKTKEKNITITKEILHKSSKLRISFDSLTQVLVNLIENAIKFSFKNNTILIRIISKSDAISICVIDKGIGFESKFKDEIFKKFTKQSKLGTAYEPSVGIGLYLSRKIIEKHNGTLTGNSDGENKGATFEIIL